MASESPLAGRNTGHDRINWEEVNRLEASPDKATNAMDDGSPLKRKDTGHERVDWDAISQLQASPETAAVLAASDVNARLHRLENRPGSRIPPPDFFTMPSSPPVPSFPSNSRVATGFAAQPPYQMNGQGNYAATSFPEAEFAQNVYTAERMVTELTLRVAHLENLIERRHEIWMECIGSWFTGGSHDWCKYRDEVFAGLAFIRYVGPDVDTALVVFDVSMGHYWFLYPLELLRRAKEVHLNLLNLRHRMGQAHLFVD